MASDSTTRFSSRVEDYVRYRPGYPPEVIDLLWSECELGENAQIADVGSGTGIFTKLLLERGATVFAVEPNGPMRSAAEAALLGNPGFRSIDGTAEHTTLGDASVDLVVAAQAFHWFDREPTRNEFVRILRSPRWCALVWNDRVEDGSPFLSAYERLLREHATDYFQVRHKAIQPEHFEAFFGESLRKAIFPNSQRFDFEGVAGRLLSSSYAPQAGYPRHAPMMEELRRIFDATSESGTVEFRYETQVFYGMLG
jgi:SAM-dependent methyltransferase